MLTLILMRHAEAGSASSDYERKLSSRGQTQAAKVGELIRGWGLCPDLVISSGVKRTVETADIVSSAFTVPPLRTVETSLYESYTTQHLLDVMAKYGDYSSENAANCILVVAHNPDISYRADALMNEPLPVGFPTAGVVALIFDADRWTDVSARSGSLLRSSFL